MAPFDDIRRGVSQVWDSLAEGWNELRERAGNAVTRFRSRAGSSELETRGEQLARHAPDWSFLPVEISEHGDRLEVRLEAPGLEPEDFDLYVHHGNLVVIGDKHFERELTEGRYHVMERAYGRFERIVPLPRSVDDSRAQARYRRGVLRVTLPLSQSDSGRRVDVEPGG
ncbi:Hsp20/alpha crystallin family protein [Ectothiorhodospiraceae bacterium WFHF3C12]|nr:Hsp20/alpha crystallin family protein [Ectothiorhodospiraceae bacterium WFHF3C12]